jgi:hypothetical protein
VAEYPLICERQAQTKIFDVIHRETRLSRTL